MDGAEMRRRVAEARVGRLASVRPDGSPHLVPIVFALDDELVYTPIDGKPKRTPLLQRLENIAANPDVELLVDHYEEEWRALWWVRVLGKARIADPGHEHDSGARLLREKYHQYGDWRLDSIIVIEGLAWRAWTGEGISERREGPSR